MTDSFYETEERWMLDPLLFEEGRLEAMKSFTVLHRPEGEDGIGTLGEKSVHRVLKYCCSPFSDGREVTVGGYVADVVGEQGIIEIQSARFDRLRDKLGAFLSCCPVTVVWPAEREKWICMVDPQTGELLSRRKSPVHQTVYGIFPELYRLREYLPLPGLRFRVALLETEEYRYKRPQKGRRAVRCDRIPLRLLGQEALDTPEDYLRLLPEGLPDLFGAKEVSDRLGLDQNSCRIMLRVMEAEGALCFAGKDGRRILFRKTPDRELLEY